jgi:hypothetical protein
MNKNGGVLHEHRFHIDLVTFQSSLFFPEVPVSHHPCTCLEQGMFAFKVQV